MIIHEIAQGIKSGICFEVVGQPKGQPRGRAVTWGGKARIYPATSADDWKALVALEARIHRPDEPLDGPLRVDICFRFQRPKNHFRTGRNAQVLKQNAPAWVESKPDRDNLDKAVLDILTQIGMWGDDAQVCAGYIEKRYVRDGERPGASIEIVQLGGQG